MGYVRRILDGVLDEVQPQLHAVSIYGPKGVGKTATATRRARSVLRLDQAADVQRLRADPGLLASLPGPLLVDEWQRWPESWDQVRRLVDDGTQRGRFLLTGSSAPRGVPIHSGAGRVVGFRLRPMDLTERGFEVPTVSLGALLSGSNEIHGETARVLADYVDEIVRSGLPAIRDEPTARLRRLQLDAYIDNIVQKEFPEAGYPVRRPEALRAWLAAYAAASSSMAQYQQILDAATPNQAQKPTKVTAITYRDALAGLWLLDPTPAWSPADNNLGRLSLASKHQLADPALVVRLLNLDATALMTGHDQGLAVRGGAMLGPLFESLVTLGVQSFATSLDAKVYHMRDRDGRHEIDLIVEDPGGRVVALEVKLAATPDDHDVRHLLWLKQRMGAQLADMAVITTGRHAYRRPDGVAVIPAALLGP